MREDEWGEGGWGGGRVQARGKSEEGHGGVVGIESGRK